MIVTVYTKDQFDELRENVKVKLFQDSELITEGTSDENGEIEFDIDTGAYLARTSSSLTPYVTETPVTMTVTEEADEFILRVQLLATPSADNPNYCRISGYLYAEDVPGDKVLVFKRVWPSSVVEGDSQLAFVHTPYKVRLDENGYVVFDLLRGARYEFTPPDGRRSWWFEVPDLSAAAIGPVLYPLVKTITPASVVVALTAGEETEVTYSQLYFSGLSLTSAALVESSSPERQFDDISGYPGSMIFESDDAAVAVVNDDCGVLRITAVAAGVANISARLAAPWITEMKPSGGGEWDDLIEVTVS